MRCRGFFALILQFTIRPILQHRLKSFLTVFGVALGLAVVGSVHLSTERAIFSFSESLRVVEGNSDFHVTGNGFPLPEVWLEKFNWFWEFGYMTPRVEGTARTQEKKEIRIYGVDLVGDPLVRDYFALDKNHVVDDEISSRRLEGRSFLDLLSKEFQILVPEKLAQQEGLELGSSWSLTIGIQTWEFRVGAILSNKGIGGAFGGHLVLMDIATAQEVLKKLGQLDRIDFKLNGLKDEGVFQRIQKQSDDNLFFYRKGDLAAQSKRMLSSFQVNLKILSYLALIVGAVLICNTVGLSSISRRSEIAILRTLGASRRVVCSLVLSESLFFGIVGAIGGVIIAPYLTSLAEIMVNRTVGEFYMGSTIGTNSTQIEFQVLVIIMLFGIGVALASGTKPAWSTTRVSPVEVLREGSWSLPPKTQMLGLCKAGASSFLLAFLLSFSPPINGLPLLGYLSCILYILAFSLGSLPAMHLVLSAIRKYVWPILGLESRLALCQLKLNISHVSLAVMSLMIAVALFVGVATMVGSFRSTVQSWINQTFVADLFVRSAGGSVSNWSGPLDSESISLIEDILGVDAVGTFRGTRVEWEGVPITLAGAEFRVLRDFGKILFMENRTSEEIVEAARVKKRVIVSEPFSRRFSLSRGDQIELKTPVGIRLFEIEAVYYDYSNDRGVVVMDRGLFANLFSDQSANTLAIYVNSMMDTKEVVRKIRSVLPGKDLIIQPNSDLRNSALNVFDQTFRITQGVEIIALIVAALGVMSTLIGLVLERRGEFALLRFLGAFPAQLRQIILAEATLLGLVGCLFGIILGQILALILIYVINVQSFGWTIQYNLPFPLISGGILVIFFSTVLIGIYPALLTGRINALRALRTE